MKPIIETENLTRFYGENRGIEALNLKIEVGEIFGFLGPNGAGKTTTIRLILNLIRPTSGRALLFGRDIRKSYYENFKRIGVVPGELSLYEEQSGIDFLNYMNRFSGRPAIMQDELCEAFKLPADVLQNKIRYYSNGMKQKLAIVQAMQEKPELLIFDEPTEGLDPLIRNVLYSYLLQLKNEGCTIFFSSHNLAEVEKICDRAGLVKEGKLIFNDTLGSLKAKLVRRMYLVMEKDINVSDFKFEGIEVLYHQENKIELLVRCDINVLIKKLADFRVMSMTFPEPSLEDAFLSFYKGD